MQLNWLSEGSWQLIVAHLMLCFRYSMLVEDGVVKKINVEPDGTGLTCSLAPNILADL